MHEEKLKLQK